MLVRVNGTEVDGTTTDEEQDGDKRCKCDEKRTKRGKGSGVADG